MVMWCVLLLDGFLPVGVREQEVLHKLRAAWTLASQEASIEMSYLHTNLPLYKRVSDPSPRPTPPSCTGCTAGLSSFQQTVKCGSGKPFGSCKSDGGDFFSLLSPSAKNPRREMLDVDNAVRSGLNPSKMNKNTSVSVRLVPNKCFEIRSRIRLDFILFFSASLLSVKM